MRVFCISGRAQHGKDTAAQMIRRILWGYGKKVLIIHYADLLKFMCKQLFAWDGNKDDRGRTLLQYVGTDVIRTQHPDFWVEYIANVLRLFGHEWDYVLIPDCRFPNEISFLSDNGFNVTHIRIERDNFDSGLTAAQLSHPSETALDGVTPDVLVQNDGSLSDLYGTLLRVLQKECGVKDEIASFIDMYT